MAAPFNEIDPVRKTYFINESERSVDPADDVGKVPQLEENGELSPMFIPNASETIQSGVGFDGSSAPKPVGITSAGFAVPSSAVGSPTNNFVGFVTQDYSAPFPTYLSAGQVNSAASGSVTANAGVDRVMIVFVAEDTTTNVSAVSWNSISGVLLDTIKVGAVTNKIFSIVIGTNGSNQSATLAITGGGGNSLATAVVYDKVNQATPTQSADIAGQTSVTSTSSPSLTLSTAAGLLVAHAGEGGLAGNQTITNAGFTQRSLSGYLLVGDLPAFGSTIVNVTTDGGSQTLLAGGAILNPANPTPIEINYKFGGIVQGFSGLTPGATYFVQDDGTLGTSAGTTSIKVGKAISATKLMVIQSV